VEWSTDADNQTSGQAYGHPQAGGSLIIDTRRPPNYHCPGKGYFAERGKL